MKLRTRNRVFWPVLASLFALNIAFGWGELWMNVAFVVVCCAFAAKWWLMPADRVHAPPGRWL